MFPFNRDRKLSQPLGQWNENYATDFQWYWRICSTTFNLYHYTQSKWKIYCPHTLQCTFVVYKQVQVAPTDANIPNNPATPLIQPNQLIITLPIARAPTMWHTEPPMEPSLLRWLTNPVHMWEWSLRYQIRPHVNIYQLHEQLARGQKLVIVSDASVNHKGHGTLAWIIHTDKKLWSGKRTWTTIWNVFRSGRSIRSIHGHQLPGPIRINISHHVLQTPSSICVLRQQRGNRKNQPSPTWITKSQQHGLRRLWNFKGNWRHS